MLITPQQKPYRNDVYDTCRVKCKCSHSIFIPLYVKSMNCNYCGRTVYNKKEQFKIRLLKEMERC